MTRTVKEIFQELENMENDNAKLIEKRQEELEAIVPTIEKAKRDIVEAKKKVDAEAYNKAKTELWTAENTKELLEEELEKLQSNPLVSKEEYHKLAKDITAAAESVNADILDKISKYFPEFEKLKENFTRNVEDANKALSKLEHAIGKNTESYKYDDQGGLVQRYHGLDYTPKKNVACLLNKFVETYNRMVK